MRDKSRLYPDITIDSAYQIDYRHLREDGYRGIIFDIDNTLVTHGAPANQQAIRLFEELKELGFACCLLSNNQEPRVKMFNDDVHVYYIVNAHKPDPQGYLDAMERMRTDRQTTLFIGDQIFTDIWGANRAGIFNILTEPIYWKEEIQIILKRRLEFFIRLGYRMYCRRMNTEDAAKLTALRRRYTKQNGEAQ